MKRFAFGLTTAALLTTIPASASLFETDFDGIDTWGYTETPDFGSFSSSGDEWDIVDAGTTITGLALDGNFVGALDLANSDNSTGEASIVFDTVSVAGQTGVSISFDYIIDAYDAAAGDSAEYEVFIDGASQGVVDLLAGGTPDSNGNNISVSGTEIIVIPDSASTVAFTLLLDNNGGDGAVFDNFEVVPEPSSLALIGLGGLLITRRRRG